MARHFYSIPASEFSPGIVLFGIIDHLHAGDVLACPDVNHIALTWSDLEWILRLLEERSAKLEVQHTARRPGESTEAGFRRDLKRAAVLRAQARGSYKNCGRKRKNDPAAIRAKRAEGKRPAEIAAELRLGIATVYRALAAA